MSTEVVQVYRCENKACPLGSRQDPGQFTSGMTKDGFFLLTGNPAGKEGKDYGEGICPSCGEKGIPSHDQQLDVGDDPYDDIHQEVAARVADDNDPLTAETSQDEVNRLVEQREAQTTTTEEGGDNA